MPVTARIRVELSALIQQVRDLATAEIPNKLTKQFDLASGVGTAGVDQAFADERTIAASGTDALDLAGVLVDDLGVTIALARVKAIVVQAIDGNVNDVHVGVGASNGLTTLFPTASSHVKVKPGGLFVWVAPGAGITVTPGTGDLLVIANSGAGTSVTYRVVIIGATS